jgi:hypothetical protein
MLLCYCESDMCGEAAVMCCMDSNMIIILNDNQQVIILLHLLYPRKQL